MSPFRRYSEDSVSWSDGTVRTTDRDYLDRWYAQKSSLPGEHFESERSATVDWLLEGDAAQRGLMA